MRQFAGVATLMAFLGVVGPAVAAPPVPALTRLAEASRTPVQVYESPTTGAPYFLRLDVPAAAFSRASSASAQGRDFWSRYGAVFGITDPSAELTLRSTRTSPAGTLRLRYDQRYRGLPVVGGQLVLHLRGGSVVAVNGHFADGIAVSTTATVSATGASWAAATAVPARGGRNVSGEPELVVHVDGFDRARLAWKTTVTSGGPLGLWRVYVDARTGEAIRLFNDLHTARNRTTYTNGNDPDCNTKGFPQCTLPGTLVRTEASPASGDATLDDTHAHTATVYDYFSSVHGRDSYDGLGHELRSTVHFGSAYNNAFWCGSDCIGAFGGSVGQMAYGDGDGEVFSPLGRDLDVVAHELTHAVTEVENGLDYFGQSGALNESYSDVFAAFIDNDGDEWLIGEASYTPDTPGDALRDMATPTPDQPASMSQYVNTWYDNGGVHINSGIPNHAAYLAATAPGYGLGRTALRPIYYEAMGCLSMFAQFLENVRCLELAAESIGGAAAAEAIRRSQAAVGIADVPFVLAPNSGETLAAGAPTTVTWDAGGAAGTAFEVYFFRTSPGTYADGFEALALPPDFVTGGDAPWTTTNESASAGLRSARSGAILDGQRSELRLVVHGHDDSPISFQRRGNTELGYDFLSFHVDGMPVGATSGFFDLWGVPAYLAGLNLSPGTHELVWVYEKDGVDAPVNDGAFIDELTLSNAELGVPTMIGTTAADAVQQAWTPPAVAGTNYRVRIRRAGVAPWLAFDESNGDFTVTAPPQPPAPQPPAPQPPAPQPPAPQPPAPQPPAPQPPAPQPPAPQPTGRCVVPNVKGKTVPAARQQLARSRCALGAVSRKFSARVKKGRIISQSRRPGARLPRGTRVNVVLSRGRRR